jgi:hypothetical protein
MIPIDIMEIQRNSKATRRLKRSQKFKEAKASSLGQRTCADQKRRLALPDFVTHKDTKKQRHQALLNWDFIEHLHKKYCCESKKLTDPRTRALIFTLRLGIVET